MSDKIEMRNLTTPMGEFAYTLTRKRVKNLNLRVRLDGSIAVSASPRVSLARIEAFLRSKAEFILQAQKRFSQIEEERPKVRTYVDGEALPLLGEILTISVGIGEKSAVRTGDVLQVTMQDPADETQRMQIVDRYIGAQFQTVVARLLQGVHELFQPFGISMPQVRLRTMKTRWGSCSPTRGAITLNRKLAHVPLECVEYVVVHEFCHFLHPDHSPAFYARLASFLPDWKERKQRLEQWGRRLPEA